MRTRLGVPLLMAVAGLLWLGGHARAAHCGAGSYSNCSTPCCEAQCCFSECQQQCKTCYQLVYDTVLEKRWHTCYKNVTETVMQARTVPVQVTRMVEREVPATVPENVMENRTITVPVTRMVERQVPAQVAENVTENRTVMPQPFILRRTQTQLCVTM